MLIVKMQSNRVMINQKLNKVNFITSEFENSAKKNREMGDTGLEHSPLILSSAPHCVPTLSALRFLLAVAIVENWEIYFKVGNLIIAMPHQKHNCLFCLNIRIVVFCTCSIKITEECF